MKIKSRKEAVEIIQIQLMNEINFTSFTKRDKGCCYSYGKQELRELMDLIYGSEPASEEEKIV